MASRDIRTDRGTAAQSGASDLALVGAVLAAFAIPTPANAEAFHIGAAVSPTADSGTSAADTSHITLIHDGGAIQQHAAGSGMAAASSLVAPTLINSAPNVGDVHASAPAVPHGSGGIAVFVPAGHGANTEMSAEPRVGTQSTDGSSNAARNADGHDGAMHPSGSVIAADPAAFETMRVSVAALHDAITALTDRLPTAPGASDAIDGVRTAASDVLAGARDTLSSLDDRLSDVTHDLVGQTDAVADRISGSVNDISERVGDIAHETIAKVADLGSGAVRDVSERVGEVTDAVGRVTDAASDLAMTATDRLADAAGGAAHHIGDIVGSISTQFAGVDPPAGIHTLVGMVSAADVFKLPDSPGHDLPLAPALGALGAADLLAEAHPSDSLLGIADQHHDGLLGGLSGHDGLFGHG